MWYSPFDRLHRFEPTQPIHLALVPAIPDHVEFSALRMVDKVQHDLPWILATTQNVQQEIYKRLERTRNTVLSNWFCLRKQKSLISWCNSIQVHTKYSQLNYELELCKHSKWARDEARLKKYNICKDNINLGT